MADSATLPFDGDRLAEPGELCTCGRQAIVVYLSERWGATGFCGLPGASPVSPCPFCGASAVPHRTKCPDYRVRPNCAGCDERGVRVEQQPNGDLVCDECGRMVSSAAPDDVARPAASEEV